ncbi:MAG: TIGR02281 family clan AA aspartic protease [Sphingomicrobium sp.]
MIRITLALLLVAGIVGWMMPSGHSTPPPVAASVHLVNHPSSSSAAPINPDLPSDAVQLQREANGHFFANVQINGSPIRVLVDTGASAIALSRSDAQRAGLPVSAGMFSVVGEGVDGDVHGEYVVLGTVSLGSKSAEKVPAVILDAGEQSLLGQSFLREFETVEIHGNVMLLR